MHQERLRPTFPESPLQATDQEILLMAMAALAEHLPEIPLMAMADPAALLPEVSVAECPAVDLVAAARISTIPVL